jgi:signal transduction histidine kinase
MLNRLRRAAEFAWPLLAPVLLGGLLYLLLREPLQWWLRGEEIYDEQAVKEWIRESRIGFRTLPELLKDLVTAAGRHTEELRGHPEKSLSAIGPHEQKRAEIQEMLRAMAAPPTKVYTGQLPLFPVIYRLEVVFDDRLREKFDGRLDLSPIVWDSDVPRHPSQYRELPAYELLREPGVAVRAQYHLHAYMQKQFKEREDASRRILLNGWGLLLAAAAFLWVYVAQRRERDRQRRQLLAEQKVHEAERRHFEGELRRQEAERKHEEAERQNLELRSQMFANISITAGSYAHNIKNLLVRPNDLLRRCLEETPTRDEQSRMLGEVRLTLGTVTERLQQILHTVRRDPGRSESVRLDLNAMVRDIRDTWAELARDKWKLNVELDLAGGGGEPLWIAGDRSHLEQVLENLLFNARDATFEMRNHLREQARTEAPDEAHRRQAIIAAAGWRGHVVLRTRRDGENAVLEVQDNGIGMTEEVRRRCTETYFSTKRDNALFAGLSAGMGVGLSFVTVILEHHHATLEVESRPLHGALFRVRFAAVGE